MRALHSHRRQGGYVLIMVLAALALITLVASRFAQRIDALRAQALSLDGYAAAQVEAASMREAALYWVSTRPLGRAGFGHFPAPELRADARLYAMPSGAELRVQDLRGLLALNVPSRPVLTQLLIGLGAAPSRADALVDVLLDYQDTDNLKRLQGAEAAEYGALGLPPPRNDFLLAANELLRMPLWRDEPALANALARVSSTNREGALNPNTMPLPLLRAVLPRATPEQLELLQTLRHNAGFDGGAAMLGATGLSLIGDDYLFHVSDRVRLTVWAPGLPHALQYNVQLDPAGANAPWHIYDTQPEPRAIPTDATPERATPFPLVIGTVQP
jgi:hypothetical protein